MKKRKADLHTMREVGTVPNVEDRAALRLARAIHYAEDTHCVVSWSAQERAEAFFNKYGMGATLDECERLESLRLPGADDDAWLDEPERWETDSDGALIDLSSKERG